ncbi:hypothetical protein HJC23_004158 [Cyclotella cryptica]|uniref:Heme-binding protein n=1 Tax=Cyclotella cryptica TaxID=29204 RepID=A0ABD3NHD0_9STRA|eukprot:CCRYP_018982-RA/>CCRYP_018982-RA protein AED:0.22 eAED:0.22 QI:0/-1/0/1/-1/1/1/0/165
MNRFTFTLEMADVLANGVVKCVKRNRFSPVVINVVDHNANVLVQKRMDGCVHAGIPEFSYAKAYTCIAMNLSSRSFRDKYTTENNPSKIAQLSSMISVAGGGGKMACFPGGVLLKDQNNLVVGAIGVSGASGDEDEYVALKSAWESGLPLNTEPNEHSCSTANDE